MKILLIAVSLLALSGCMFGGVQDPTAPEGSTNGGNMEEVAACVQGGANTDGTILGQMDTDGTIGACRCRISPEAGLRVTSAHVDAQAGGQCYMEVAPKDDGADSNGT